MQLAHKFISSRANVHLVRSLGQPSFSGNMTMRRANMSAKAFEPESVPFVSVVGSKCQDWEGDLLVVAAFEDDFATENELTSMKSDSLVSLDKDFGNALSDILVGGGFAGKQGTTSKVVRVGAAPGAKAKYVSLAGLGKMAKAGTAAEWGPTAWQALGGSIAALSKANKAKSVGVSFLDAPTADASALVCQLASGVLIGGYETTLFKSKKSPTASPLEAVHIMLPAVDAAAAAAACSKAETIARGTTMTRYLVEAPPNICTPTFLAEAAQHIADKFPGVMKCNILEKAQCEEMGMGCYLGVAEASDEPPKFIHLVYTPPASEGGAAPKKVALVGKGLTFDSGGYNIKAGPGSMIELMKFDMGGAAATLGAARIIAGMQPPGVEVHFIVASCENMIAGHGLRPGDILTAASGKTVEVNNTDAEGRLTLADALWYAQEKCGVSAIVDSATLTGACIVALGPEIAGLLSPSDTAADAVIAASKAAGEKIWRMPMENNYFEQLKSPIADMKNTGMRGGGTITAALFLKEFVKDEVEWAHVDMAGPVWDSINNVPTGYGAHMLATWAVAQGSPKP